MKTVHFRRLGHLLGVRITSPGRGRHERPPKIVADATQEPAATLNPLNPQSRLSLAAMPLLSPRLLRL